MTSPHLAHSSRPRASRLRGALLRVLLATVATATVVPILLSSPAVYAQSVDRELEKQLQQAMEDYDVLEIESAEKKLEDAIDTALRRDASGPVLAKLYVMLGVVRHAATRDDDAVEETFVDALRADPSASIPDVYKTPTLDQLMESARAKVGPGESQAQETQEPGEVDGLTHTPIKTAQAGQSLEFEAFVPSDMPVYRMYVHHRRFDEDEFKRTEMEPTSTTRFATKLAPKYIATSQIDYYVLAEDRAGNVIAKSGDELNPYEIVVLGSGEGTGGDGVGGDVEDPGVDAPYAAEQRTWVYVMAAGGTDVGFLPGGVPTANPDRVVSPGIAPAFGHAYLDIGTTLTPRMHLGMFFRYQFAPAQNFASLPEGSPSIDPGSGFWDTKQECLGLGIPGDCILGLKYKLFFSDTGPTRIYSSIGTGVGRVRNWLRLKQPTDPDDPGQLCENKAILFDEESGAYYCFIRDTVRTGWLHFGLGGGMAFPITDTISFVADSYLMVLVPEVSINLDLQGGLQFAF